MYQVITGRQFPEKVVPLIDGAKHNIKIVIFDWRWYPNDSSSPAQLFNQAFVRACRRGVKVQVICNISDVFKFLENAGAVCRQTISKNMVHAKMMVIDDDFVVIGSHNYTQNAFTMNRELSVIISNENTFCDFNNFFNTLWLL